MKTSSKDKKVKQSSESQIKISNLYKKYNKSDFYSVEDVQDDIDFYGVGFDSEEER